MNMDIKDIVIESPFEKKAKQYLLDTKTILNECPENMDHVLHSQITYTLKYQKAKLVNDTATMSDVREQLQKELKKAFGDKKLDNELLNELSTKLFLTEATYFN